MPKFLSGKEILNHAASICADPRKDTYLSVAYWGLGAVDALDLNAARSIRVALDVEAGGTNPRELKKLCSRIGRENIRVRSKLHAKIYANKNVAVVGSANASRNGLHFHGDGNYEAAVLLYRDAAKDAFEFAKKQFECGDCLKQKHFEKCWKAFRRRTTALAEEGEFLSLELAEALFQQPECISNLPLILSDEPVTAETLQKEWKIQRDKISPNETSKDFDQVSNHWDGYEWKIHKDYVGKICLGIHCEPQGDFTASVFRPAEPSEGFTFVRYLPWRHIAGIKHKQTGSISLKFSESNAANRFRKAFEALSERGAEYQNTWELIDQLI